MPRTRKKTTKGSPTFIEHEVEAAAQMLTIEPDDGAWKDLKTSAYVEEAFVRLSPPSGVTPEEVAKLKTYLIDTGGARAVKTLPIPGDVVADAPGDPVVPMTDVLTMRQIVHARAKRTPNVRDADALDGLLDDCMDKAGL